VARPKAKQLTDRELEVMHVVWTRGPSTVAEVRDALAEQGRDLAYTTVATLVRILTEKQFLEQTGEQRPFVFRPLRTFEEVSGSMVGDLVKQLFHGSREQLLLRLFDQKQLTEEERSLLQDILRERDS
jgi:predicted transcriptional regulator